MFKNKRLNVGAWEQRLAKERGTEAGKATAIVQLICLLQKLAQPSSPSLRARRRGPDRMPHCRPPTAKKSSNRVSSLGPEKGGIWGWEPRRMW